MNYFLKILISIFALLLMIISVYFTFNIKLDASSDTLILKNDKTFEYFEYYNNIFPSKNFLILAVKSNKNVLKRAKNTSTILRNDRDRV